MLINHYLSQSHLSSVIYSMVQYIFIEEISK